jgi:simple sugar transport system permease protein
MSTTVTPDPAAARPSGTADGLADGTADDLATLSPSPATTPPHEPDRRSFADRARSTATLAAALASAIVIYAAFLVAKGASPGDVFQAMWDSAFGDADSIGETFLRTAPLLLGALAVALPATAGLFNIGGQGQMLLGGIAASGAAYALGENTSQPVSLVVMGLAAALGGMAWAAIPALLRVVMRANEAITSLLLNYVAATFLSWLVFEPWKDPTSLGQAYSEALTESQRLPIMWGSRVNAGILIAPIAAIVVFVLLRSTRWGFRLRVLGGNPDAAFRAGFRVRWLAFSAMAAGGMLAGLAGFVEIAGVEGRLRPDVMPGYGYVAFLAAWLARHHPLRAVLAAFVLAAIAVGGTGLKISAGLSGAAVNILMALVLLAVLGWGRRSEA